MSNLQRMKDNVNAIEFALTGKGENGQELLNKFTGFGGLGFVLLPLDKSKWSKSDLVCYAETERLHKVLREASADEQEYSRWLASIKESTLTAFYTPEEVANGAMRAIYGMQTDYYGKGVCPQTVLDPAAGSGVFGTAALVSALGHCVHIKLTSFEKDLLTGKILKAKRSAEGDTVYVDAFENIPSTELGKFDLVTTNVPFCNSGVYDPKYSRSDAPSVFRDAARMVHRYYVLKGLDCLRDGGLLAYIITSNYINHDTEQLAEAFRSSRLIGAYRLANNLFKENGTEVGTDLIVLQKDASKTAMTADECMLITPHEVGGCPTSYYFALYPERIIATNTEVGTDAYGKPGLVYTHRDGVKGIADMLSKALAKDMRELCDVELYEKGRVQSQGTSGTAKVAKKSRITKKDAALQKMHEIYADLYELEQQTQRENADLRRMLNGLYDEFVKTYGHLNDPTNRQDVQRVAKELLSLEIDGGNSWQKADIMFKPVAFSADERTEPMTAREALAASLNEHGTVWMDEMEEATGKSTDELVEELAGEIFWNPIVGAWEIKARFVSGNVIEKIEAIRSIPDVLSDPRVAVSLAALEAAVPTPIPFADLDFNLGERWVPAKLYADFASNFFTMPDDAECSWKGGRAEVEISYQPEIDQYSVACDSSNERIRSEYSVQSEASNLLDGIDLLTHALHNTTPKLMRYKRNQNGCIETRLNSKGEEEPVKEEDPEKIQLANTKIEEIRQGYADWLQQQPKALRDRLEQMYNRRFNCFVKPAYDGSHQTFPGIDWQGLTEKYGVRDLYKSQKDCIWMLLMNGGGICDHEVGSGKTLIMCVAAHEMKRLGMAHKPMIIGLKANVSAIAETYRTAYPKAKVLFATEVDYSASNRVDFFNRAKNNDWDCIIMSHEQFGKIPQSLEVQEKMVQEELAQIDASLEALNGSSGASKKQLKGLEIRKKNRYAMLLDLQNQIAKQKDDVVDFEMLGIDHILIDESHQFKNLGFVTRHDRVAGLGNTKGSQRAYNLLIALRTIQRRTGRDLGATFLSGTTVTNSLTELYLLFGYLRPGALRKQGITCFDAWAAIFTKKTSEYEFSVTNSIVLKERFRYFIKVPELAMFYNEITDYKTAEDVGIVRPSKDPVLYKIPLTPDQEEYVKVLMEFAKTGDFRLIGIDHPTKQQEMAKMLYATDLARKMSLDMRLIDPAYGDHPDNKASRCAAKVKLWYDAFDAMKGTQLIFSDLSTWQGKGQWSIYGEIKRKLIDDYGIPASEIRFIQEAKNDAQKQEIIRLTNEGKVRVLFGSTTMLGTGVNAQQRVVAVHHLDTPWRPADLEQRDGRAVRKGNEIAATYQGNKVKVIIYAVERSLDSYKFNILHCKQVFISQLKRGNLNVRTLDEGAMDEKTGMDFASYMAVLSGNTDLLERAKTEKRIAALEGERKAFYRQRAEQEEKAARLTTQNAALGRDIAAARKDQAQYEKVRELDAQGKPVNRLAIDNFAVGEDYAVGTSEWTAAMARELIRIDNDTLLPPMQYKTVGSIYGFPLLVRTEQTGTDKDGVPTYRNHFVVKGHLLHTIDNGRLNHGVLQKAAGYALACLEEMAVRIEKWQSKMDANRRSIAQLESIIAQQWGKEELLVKLRIELVALDKKIGESLNSTEDKPAADQTKQGKPFSFNYDRGEYTVNFKRRTVSLVTFDEMNERARGNDDDWRSIGHVHCWDYRWKDRRYVPIEGQDPEVHAVFRKGEDAEKFILGLLDLQASRMADRQWLADHAALDTEGSIVTRDNETIFAARQVLAQMAPAEAV